MRLPLRYSVRNLMRRKVRTLLTVLAIALAVGISVGLFAFARGVIAAARDSGSDQNVLIIDRKAANASFSSIRLADFNLLKSLPQVARDPDGNALLSPEVVHQCRVQAGEQPNGAGTVRGVSPQVFAVNPRLRMLEGSPPSSGRQVAVGELAAAALRVPHELLAIGRQIRFEGETWEIVGRFSTGGSAMDGEILASVGELMAVLNRDTYSCVVATAASRADVAPMVKALNSRNDIQFKAVVETEYYRSLADGYQRVIALVLLVSVMATAGGLVSGLNTMYASVMGRLREIGTLKVMGFSNGTILGSFMVESMVLALLGAVLGCALALPVDGMGARFTSSALRVSIDFWAVAGGAVVAMVIGVAGALAAAMGGLRMSIIGALNAH
ncbi:MAG: ABC transporter permease [Planctomycetes bacterium]|nr:ABC transporter permease [Planctomycetota bacterium]